MSDVELDYTDMMQRAFRAVMREALEITAELGATPGEHHFYIEFATDAPGVTIPDHLRQEYPLRMTIVLQHQFEDLVVREDEFAVTLGFKGRDARLCIPFDAVTSFADPSVEFGLRFSPADPAARAPSSAKKDEPPETPPAAPPGAEVVSLDKFRKK